MRSEEEERKKQKKEEKIHQEKGDANEMMRRILILLICVRLHKHSFVSFSFVSWLVESLHKIESESIRIKSNNSSFTDKENVRIVSQTEAHRKHFLSGYHRIDNAMNYLFIS